MRKISLIAVLLTLTWPAVIHAASRAKPCGIRFESLSRISGQPGDIVKMYGEWGQSQDEKIACINKGGMNKLDIISWSDSVIEAKIPQGLAPGKYKAGVYCNGPSKGGSFASRWMDFEILSAETGLQPENQPGGTVDDRVSPTAGGRSESARKTPKGPGVGLLGAVTNKKLTIFGIIAIAVIILLIRRFSETRMTMPSAYDAKKQYLGKTGSKSIGQTAQHNGEEYYISVSTDRIFTIEISPSFPLSKKYEVNARTGLPSAADFAGWGEDVKALLSLGVNYIDVGVNGSRVAAELPFKSSVETVVLEKIVEHLIRLRDFSR